MKKCKKIKEIELSLLYKRLCERKNYPYPKGKWREIVEAWGEYMRRFKKRKIDYADILKEGKISKKDAVSLSEYVGCELV